LGWLVQGPLGQVVSLPLVSRIHEGLVFTNRDRRTLLDKLVTLFLGVAQPFSGPLLLLVDAYYASGKILRPLGAAGHQVLARVRRNAVAYRAAPAPAKRRRGRPRLYGPKVRLRDLWGLHYQDFISAPSPVYGESGVTLRYFSLDLLWRPLGHRVRFVLVRHPRRGKIILMCPDLHLTALEIIAGYGLRFKIELSFRQALHTLGTYAYHFWMSAMTPLPRRSGNQYLHRTSKNYRRLVRRKIDAYHRYVQLGCIAQGLLQYLALSFRTEVWRCFRSWLRTMNPAQPPSEAVVAQALRASLPEFLLGSPEDNILKKFILENLDFDRCPGFQLAA
jgi:hypothetical protein